MCPGCASWWPAAPRSTPPIAADITPLMWAAAGGSVELTTYLLERGARVDSRAGDGATALYFAAANGATDVVKLLLARGADPSAARDGRTPRQAALARGHADLAAVLQQAETRGSRDRGGAARWRRAARPHAAAGAGDRRHAPPSRCAARPGCRRPRVPPATRIGAPRRRCRSCRCWRRSGRRNRRRTTAPASPTSRRRSRRRSGGSSPEQVGAMLPAVADDLEAKLEHCRASGGKLGGSVVVRVRTVQAGAEAGRWQVFYMPKILEVSPVGDRRSVPAVEQSDRGPARAGPLSDVGPQPQHRRRLASARWSRSVKAARSWSSTCRFRPLPASDGRARRRSQAAMADLAGGPRDRRGGHGVPRR